MIRTRTRMFGSRTVVLLAEPTHPALARGGVRHSSEQRPEGRDLLGEALRALALAAATVLLRRPPRAFETSSS